MTGACEDAVAGDGFCAACDDNDECGEGFFCANSPVLNQGFCSNACADNGDCVEGAICAAVQGARLCIPGNFSCAGF